MAPAVQASNDQPILIVFLENGGRVAGLALPRWASRLLDWTTEEYAKLVVRLQARRHYRRIVVLEDRSATAAALWEALLAAGDAVVDILLLVHGQPGFACGFANQWVGRDFFDGMRRLRAAGLARFRLRAVYQMNCHGESLAGDWLSLGARAVNGAAGVNWLPEPSLSVFLANWLNGQTFGQCGAQLSRRQPAAGPGLAAPGRRPAARQDYIEPDGRLRGQQPAKTLERSGRRRPDRSGLKRGLATERSGLRRPDRSGL